MIYSYTYIDHSIQKFHEGLTLFFKNLLELDLPVYDEKQHIPEWFKDSVNASTKLLSGNLTAIVSAYNLLTNEEKGNIRDVFESNMNVAELCRGNGYPKKYESITNGAFRESLGDFFESLWNRLGNKETGVNQKVEQLCGKILSHYQTFKSHPNHIRKLCPFCGLSDLLPSLSIHRPAYDHYLPKAQYPFVSVNFENLVPMCHDCNSYEKTTTDPLNNNGVRRIVYYPFDILPENHFEPRVVKDSSYDAVVSSSLLKSVDWHIDLFSTGLEDDRLTAWDAIFRLTGRYAEYINDYEQTWYDDLIREYSRKELTISFNQFRNDYLTGVQQEMPFIERSAVRYAYLYFILYEDNIETDLNLLTSAA